LSKDFLESGKTPKVEVEVKVPAPFDAKLVSNSVWGSAPKKDEVPAPEAFKNKLNFSWSHPSGFTLGKLELTPEGADTSFVVTTETSLTKIPSLPGLKVEFKGNDDVSVDKTSKVTKQAGEVSFEYKHDLGSVTGSVDIIRMDKASFSVAGGKKDIVEGLVAGASVNLQHTKEVGYTIADFGVGASYAVNKEISSGATYAVNKGSKEYEATVLGSYKYSDEVTVAAKVAYAPASKNTSSALVAVYKCNPNTVIKALLSSDASLGLSVKQTLAPSTVAYGYAKFSSPYSASPVLAGKLTLG